MQGRGHGAGRVSARACRAAAPVGAGAVTLRFGRSGLGLRLGRRRQGASKPQRGAAALAGAVQPACRRGAPTHLLGVGRPLRGVLGGGVRSGLLGLLLRLHLLQPHARGCRRQGRRAGRGGWEGPSCNDTCHPTIGGWALLPAPGMRVAQAPPLTPQLLPVVAGHAVEEGRLLDGVLQRLDVLGRRQGGHGGAGVASHAAWCLGRGEVGF